MIHDGRVLGLPLVSYVGLKAEIEALTLTAADAGAFALATNPGALQLGFYTGTAWIWSLSDIVEISATEPSGLYAGKIWVDIS